MTIDGKSSDKPGGSAPAPPVADVRLGSGPVLIIAVGGVDPTGGAGVVRDLLTARTFGARVRVIPTAWTEQSAAAGVSAVEPRDPEHLRAAVEAACRAAARERIPAAIKVGMLPDARAVEALLAALGGAPDSAGGGGFEGPVVVDPVLGASSGGRLFRGAPSAWLALLARGALATPNLPEAAWLLGRRDGDLATASDAADAGHRLVQAGAAAVLVKGGHLQSDEAVDTLVTRSATRQFTAKRIEGPKVRGTGCALATAIAVGLGRGLALEEAVAGAKAWLHGALGHAVAAGDEWHLD